MLILFSSLDNQTINESQHISMAPYDPSKSEVNCLPVYVQRAMLDHISFTSEAQDSWAVAT